MQTARVSSEVSNRLLWAETASERMRYYRRVFDAYLRKKDSHLRFWHDVPRANPQMRATELGEYYMDFSEKANYAGAFDEAGIPMLDYRGALGRQYNPIAIAQWGLGNHCLHRQTRNPEYERRFQAAAEWLCSHLVQNASGLWVWNHHFDWEYRERLRAPWYSALAQGQGISLLVRAHREIGDERYLDAARRAFETFLKPADEGGVTFIDCDGDTWFEEYIVSPPTHILNGFIWAMWGVYDFQLATDSPVAKDLFTKSTCTLKKNLSQYDLGFWSLYEQSGTWLPMIASPFYHCLHIVQLRIMHILTGEQKFADYAEKWQRYANNRAWRMRAICYKSAFKLCYY